MPTYAVRGSFYARRGYWQPFTKVCEASSPDRAKEWALSQIGGCHHIQRHLIRITEVAEGARP